MVPLPPRRSPKVSAEINVVPYIDVMLVLLVIFMLTTPILEQGVEVELPQAESKLLDISENKPVVITVSKDGKYAIEERKNLSANKVIAFVQAAKQLKPQVQIMVRGDKHVAYGKVIELMTYLQLAGIDKIGFVTESPQLTN